jgi:hypothetical protein
MGKDANAAAVMGPIFKTKLLGEIQPAVDKAILGLAKRKSPVCWYKTKRLLEKQKQVPQGFSDLLASIKAVVPPPVTSTGKQQQ